MLHYSHMPQLSPRSRPGLFWWSGLVILVIVTIVVIKVIFTSVKEPGLRVSTVGQSMTGGSPSALPMIGSDAYALRDESAGMMAYAPTQKSAVPPMIPSSANMMRRVVKTGALTLRVGDAPKAVDQARAIATGRGGFLESSSVSDPGSGPRSAWATIRVPSDKFDDTVKDLKAIASLVVLESVNGEDVTAQAVDLDANLRNAQAEEQSYLDIMKRAGNIEDTLAVASRLAEVRGRIERYQAEKRYLDSRTELATISATFTEDTRIEVPGRTWRPLEVARQALRDLVEALQNLVDFAIRFFVAAIGLLLPVLAIIALFIWIGWKIVKSIIKRFTR